MSTRALRRLRGKQRGQEALDFGDLRESPGEQAEADTEEEQLDSAAVSPNSKGRKTKKNKAQKNISNIYELVKRQKIVTNWNYFVSFLDCLH